MTTKKATTLLVTFLFIVISQLSYAENREGATGEMKHQHMNHSVSDERISLGLSPKMKQHQLSNMRSHLVAIRDIVGLIAEGDFEKASEISHQKLGLTERMRSMCNRINNETFSALGLAFHESGDTLGETLKTGDTEKSLRALQETMSYCVECHATFRQ